MSLPTSHTRNESITDRYSDIRMQKTMTTVVEPRVSERDGKDTFFISPRTSVINNRIDSVMRLNIRLFVPTPLFPYTLKTRTCPASCSLVSLHRWCPSGRPELSYGSRYEQFLKHCNTLKRCLSRRAHHKRSGSSKLCMAGALGFEPRLSVLETDVLPLTLCPYSGRDT